ncbi:hypothetical protein [Actinoallomurus soli]|uniref:hypothetical protein n=1 Tax=Actinoallomurus soli TaxID=2952535 RepID=UPI0020922D47|nr:hypothetical protein [Actinoallomurus soli]MCO5970862.1 hypothetical protein [Actinoallomurus soli]
MIDSDPALARRRLDAALDDLAAAFAGMTARPDEYNCPCHWGSAEELAQLKTPDMELDPDLLRRTWQAPDWTDHPAVLRRILPQFASALVNGSITPWFGMEEAGRCLARGQWQQWPTAQATAVQTFLDAWWAHTLTDPDPAVPAYEVFAANAEASATLTPWLAAWEATRHPVADRHLLQAVAHWESELLDDNLPWDAWEDEERTRVQLTAWLVSHAPARLRACGDAEELLHKVRLLGLSGPARWDDPHWPGHRR